jgi:digeranylgeranylglycerophospholipid reductase
MVVNCMSVPADWDVLVVGAGPAGSRAAAAAAAAGARTLLIDAKRSIGEQPHCGEYVHGSLFEEYHLDAASVIQEVEAAELLILDLGLEEKSSREGLKAHGSSRHESMSNPVASGIRPERNILWRHQLMTRGRMIDRVRFDRDLARHAASCGAMVLSSSRFVRVQEGAWVVRCRGREMPLNARCVVAADGVLSSVAASMGMESVDEALGVQVEVPIACPGNKILLFFCRAFFGGYGWLFPKGNVANVGLGVVQRKGVNPDHLLEELLDWLCCVGMILPGRLAHYQGMVPFSGMRPTVVKENVIFCGDAAGLSDPVTGGGIVQAVVSGDLAGRAAARTALTGTQDHLQAYQESILALYGETNARALSRRKAVMYAWDDSPFEQLVRAAFLDPGGPLTPDTSISSYLRGS